MNPQRRFKVRSGDVDIAVNEYSVEHPLTLVLVHGYPDCSDVWQHLLAPLSEHFHLVTYDVRGCGVSSAPASKKDYSLEWLAKDFRTVIDAVSPDKPVHLLAHDWGSIQCWEPVTDPDLQARIKSFTTVSGPSLDHIGFWLRNGLTSLAPSRWAAAGGQIMHSWYVWLFQLPLISPALWKWVLGSRWHKMLANSQHVQAAPSATQTQDGVNGIELYRANILRVAAPQQRSTRVPVQQIIPVNDDFVTPALVRDCARPWVQQLWSREISAGHWAPLSHSALLAEQVIEFVTFIEGGDASPALQRARVTGQTQPFSNKLAVVTGAGSGIGCETALALARQGADIVLADINLTAAEATAEQIRHIGRNARCWQVDVGDAAAMEAFAEAVRAEWGAPDIVVNNAGIGMAGKFIDTTITDWEKIIHVNLWGVIHGSRLFGQQMLTAGKPGTLVNVSSGLGYAPSRMLPAYSTTKAAVLMLNDCIRAELADDSIHVVSICPGVVDTGITKATFFVGVDAGEQERLRASAKKFYQRRNLPPTAVADAIVNAIIKGKEEVPVGIEAKVGRWLTYIPGMTRRMAKMEMKM